MYDESLKLESYPNDWSIRHREENERLKIVNKGTERSSESGDSWTFRGKKDERYHKSTIEVAPMTI